MLVANLVLTFSLLQVSFACLATVNPMPDTTTTAAPTTTTTPCICRNPRNTAATECNSQPVNLPMFTTTGQCQLSWSGCTNYRYVINGMCVMGPQAQNPATLQGMFTCPGQNMFPVDANGVTIDAVDCG